MMAKIKDVLEVVGSNSASYASRIGCRTSALARRVGPKRGGIALGVLAVAIAAPFIVRAIRARRAEREVNIDDLNVEPGVTTAGTESQPRGFRRARGTMSPNP
jgi:hypothetical protein